MFFLGRKIISPSVTGCSLILILMSAIVGLFELLPAVDHARASFSVSSGNTYNCNDVLRSRPWYGQINSWLWFWLISTPVIVFSVLPSAPAWQRAGRLLFLIALSHVVINLGMYLAMEIKNAPFRDIGMSNLNEMDSFKFSCIDIADGAKYSFALYFAWTYAVVYAGLWEMMWGVYHKRKTKLIDENFKRDWISRIVVFTSVAIPVSVVGFAIWIG